MRPAGSPIQGVLQQDNRLHCVSNADLLADYLHDQLHLLSFSENSLC